MLPFENKYFEAGDIYFKIIKVEPQSYLLVSEEKGAICECLTITDNSIKIEKIVLAEEIKEYVINKKAFSETDPETYEYFEDLFSESESIEEILKIK